MSHKASHPEAYAHKEATLPSMVISCMFTYLRALGENAGFLRGGALGTGLSKKGQAQFLATLWEEFLWEEFRQERADLPCSWLLLWTLGLWGLDLLEKGPKPTKGSQTQTFLAKSIGRGSGREFCQTKKAWFSLTPSPKKGPALVFQTSSG